ncbi:hypothetical protein SAMN04490357_7667 [Streptomyces misionensis]|uniref:Uncharacterized protein n=1 Tax=Streptomyces misionensis TaxID=67331 RepID=A0A1H5K1W4_9ACTN|nr:hypothetical protein [Streptomyces misionensis]SEE58826.1 hypothetical protein SAMN04490357_7667 [Streptomyces misionensis]
MSADTAAAVAAIRLGLQTLRHTALGDTADHEDQAHVLQALYDDRHREGSVLGMVSDMLTDLGLTLGDQGAEDAAEAVDEAAAYVQDSAGLRLERARTVLTGQRNRT